MIFSSRSYHLFLFTSMVLLPVQSLQALWSLKSYQEEIIVKIVGEREGKLYVFEEGGKPINDTHSLPGRPWEVAVEGPIRVEGDLLLLDDVVIGTRLPRSVGTLDSSPIEVYRLHGPGYWELSVKTDGEIAIESKIDLEEVLEAAFERLKSEGLIRDLNAIVPNLIALTNPKELTGNEEIERIGNKYPLLKQLVEELLIDVEQVSDRETIRKRLYGMALSISESSEQIDSKKIWEMLDVIHRHEYMKELVPEDSDKFQLLKARLLVIHLVAASLAPQDAYRKEWALEAYNRNVKVSLVTFFLSLYSAGLEPMLSPLPILSLGGFITAIAKRDRLHDSFENGSFEVRGMPWTLFPSAIGTRVMRRKLGFLKAIETSSHDWELLSGASLVSCTDAFYSAEPIRLKDPWD